jgi:predicted metal-dependent phosphoesterase TrpH
MTGPAPRIREGESFADLHLHTRYSDGTYSPKELVGSAVANRLAAISLTDHDTVEGCEETAALCAAAGIEFITGTELTAEHGGTELHILGYHIDTSSPALLSAMGRFQTARQERIKEMVSRLNEMDIPLTTDAVMSLANCRSPGRPHVGLALVRAGICASVDEAFDRFLKKHRPAWVPKMLLSAVDAISLIHAAGGVAVIAHPGLNRIDSSISSLVEAGLDGIECLHSKHTPVMTDRYGALARRLGLLITGGSDCHGFIKGTPLMGTIKLPYHYVTSLGEKAASLAQKSSPLTEIQH